MPLTKEDKVNIEKVRKSFSIFIMILAIFLLSFITIKRFERLSSTDNNIDFKEELMINDLNFSSSKEDTLETLHIKDKNISIDLPSSWIINSDIDNLNPLTKNSSFEVLLLVYDLSLQSMGSTVLSIQEISNNEIETIDSFIELLKNDYKENDIDAVIEIEGTHENDFLINITLSSMEISVIKAKGIVTFLDNRIYLTNLYSTEKNWNSNEELFNNILDSLNIESLNEE